jgi:hypothetical protein
MDGLVDPATSVLPVGDHRRTLAARAAVRTLIVSVAFVLLAFVAKEVRSLAASSPWQDDPYDAVVSFTIFFVPLIVAVCFVRMRLWRREEPLQVQRVIDVLRGCRAALGAILVTLLADWTAVALRANSTAWSDKTWMLISGLGALTVIAMLTAFDVRRASSRLPRQAATDARAPDWLDDAVVVAERYLAGLGPLGAHAVDVLRLVERLVISRVRRHPMAAAAALGVGFGCALAATQVIVEGFGPTVWLDILFGGSAFFAFIVAAGSYLGLVHAESPMSPASRRGLDAAVAGCAAIWVALAFRDALWWTVGTRAATARPIDVAELLGIAGSATFLAVLGSETLAQSHADPSRT